MAQDVFLTWVLHLLVWAITSGLHAALNQVLARDGGREVLWWDTRCILYSLPAWELWKKSTKIIQEENLCTGKHTDKNCEVTKVFPWYFWALFAVLLYSSFYLWLHLHYKYLFVSTQGLQDCHHLFLFLYWYCSCISLPFSPSSFIFIVYSLHQRLVYSKLNYNLVILY